MNFAEQTVFLADDEWGNQTMELVATEKFAAWNRPEQLVLCVYEHAGWALTFTMLNGTLTTLSSANEGAYYPKKIIEWWREYNQAHRDHRILYVDPIRREKKEKVAA
jgi:hypothetical protein